MIPDAVREFAERIANQPRVSSVSPRALLVGGYVRDHLLGRETKDLDLEVYGVAADQIPRLLEESFGRPANPIGASFGIYKMTLDDGVDLDVSMPRTESKRGRGHRGFAVQGDPDLSFAEAARRRDFTMNAIMMDPLTDEIFDPYHGRDDLAAGILRMVDPATFVDDPLRVFRAMQFVARFDLGLDLASREVLAKMVQGEEMLTLSTDRITDEWRKMLRAEAPSRGLAFLHEIGLLERMYPELFELKQIQLDENWHPEGDAFTHALSAVDAAVHIDGKLEVVLGALCHDMRDTKNFLKRFSFGSVIEQIVLACTAEYAMPAKLYREWKMDALSEQEAANQIRICVKRIMPATPETLLSIGEAHARASADAEEIAYPVRSWFLERIPDLDPLVEGSDILRIARKAGKMDRFSPGPQYGQLLAEIEDMRDRGEIQNREQALDYLKSKIV